MAWVVTGTCNRCGKCCKPPVVVDNPCCLPPEDRCRFYVETDNGQKFGHCLILGRGNKPIQQVRDRFNNRITQEQIDWFEANCPQFPQACVQELRDGLFELPEGCSFTLTWVED